MLLALALGCIVAIAEDQRPFQPINRAAFPEEKRCSDYFLTTTFGGTVAEQIIFFPTKLSRAINPTADRPAGYCRFSTYTLTGRHDAAFLSADDIVRVSKAPPAMGLTTREGTATLSSRTILTI